MQGRYLLTDYRIVWSFIDIDLRPMSILFRDVGIGENCFHRALGHARVAINAGVGIDVKTIRQFVKSFDRTHSSAVGIFAVNT
jgi:hypothetical protein